MSPLISMLIAVSTTMETHFPGGPALDKLIDEAIEGKRIPGAVLVVGHRGHVAYKKAYGRRALVPQVEPMTVDTIFDCASLTKVVVTTTCIMKLLQQGRLRLNDHVTDYFPEFQGGKSSVTIRNLLTHFSGLKPDVPLKPKWSGYSTGIELACRYAPSGEPGKEHVYSDINFELLGDLVRRISGKSLDQYAHDELFVPLGMKDSTYNPPSSWTPRIAPTEPEEPGKPMLRGIVHDPTARYMGGVAGHAGLFSTGDDLARFCQMMLDKGRIGRKRFVSEMTIDRFTEPQTPIDQPILRGLGWDIDSPYSSNRGDLFPIGSYGHTGFTGTSIWIDPASQTYVILLTNHLHPVPNGGVIALRSKVATVVAASVGIVSQKSIVPGYNLANVNPSRRVESRPTAPVRNGIDSLPVAEFSGKRVGLVTNHTGLTMIGERTVDILAKSCQLATLFSPEHGWAGTLDHPKIGDTRDAKTGLPVFSLYGESHKPTAKQLENIDILVFDIQDVGARFYTYESTLFLAIEACATAKIPLYVLDRPNPITGVRVEGPPLEPDQKTFVGHFVGLPIRHGMTMGELALMYNSEAKVGAILNVVRMENWQRGFWFDSTQQTWTSPSPNMRSLNAALLYPGLCLLEYAPNYSVGRGTDAPFEQIGADFIDGRELATYLNKRSIPGVRSYATRFTPTESKFANQAIEGVRFVITDRERVNSVRLGLEVAAAIQHLYPGKMDFSANTRLIGNKDVVRRIALGQDPIEIMDSYRDALSDFQKRRAKYLLY